MATSHRDTPGDTSKRGFASMDDEKQREIASQGGKAAHAKGTAHEFDAKQAREVGSKGGKTSQSEGHTAKRAGEDISKSDHATRGHATKASAKDDDAEDEDIEDDAEEDTAEDEDVKKPAPARASAAQHQAKATGNKKH